SNGTSAPRTSSRRSRLTCAYPAGAERAAGRLGAKLGEPSHGWTVAAHILGKLLPAGDSGTSNSLDTARGFRATRPLASWSRCVWDTCRFALAPTRHRSSPTGTL